MQPSHTGLPIGTPPMTGPLPPNGTTMLLGTGTIGVEGVLCVGTGVATGACRQTNGVSGGGAAETGLGIGKMVLESTVGPTGKGRATVNAGVELVATGGGGVETTGKGEDELKITGSLLRLLLNKPVGRTSLSSTGRLSPKGIGRSRVTAGAGSSTAGAAGGGVARSGTGGQGWKVGASACSESVPGAPMPPVTSNPKERARLCSHRFLIAGGPP